MRRADDNLPVIGESRPGDRRFVVAPHLMLEAHGDTHAVIVNTASGARVKVSASVYGLLARFDAPRTIADVFGRPDDERALSRIQALLERRLLVDADDTLPEVQPRRRATPYRFCHTPPHSAAGVGADIVVLGVPYDLGGPGHGRDGPQAIRQKSLDYTYLVDFDTRRPAGWFDARRGERILEGVAIADADDLIVTYGETQATTFDRLIDALDDVLPSHGIPLVLGGDRSITFAVAACLARRHPLSVVLLAADTSMAEPTGEMVTVHDVGRALAALDGVGSVATLGLRHGEDEAGEPGLTEITVSTLRDTSRFDIGRDLPMEGAVLLSIDLGVVDAATPPTGDGLSLREVYQVIDVLGKHRRIAGLVVSGLDPDGITGSLCAIVACHLALHAMHVAMRSREGTP